MISKLKEIVFKKEYFQLYKWCSLIIIFITITIIHSDIIEYSGYDVILKTSKWETRDSLSVLILILDFLFFRQFQQYIKEKDKEEI